MPEHEFEVLRAREMQGREESGVRYVAHALTAQEVAHLEALDRYLKAGGSFPASYLAAIRKVQAP